MKGSIPGGDSSSDYLDWGEDVRAAEKLRDRADSLIKRLTSLAPKNPASVRVWADGASGSFPVSGISAPNHGLTYPTNAIDH